MAPSPQVCLRLAEISRERARFLAPALLVTFVFYIVADRALGYEASGLPYIYAWSVAAVLAALTVAAITRRIPVRWSCLASTSLVWCSTSSTLLTLASTHATGPVLLVLIQVVSAGILLDTRWVLITVGGITAASIPLFVSVPGVPATMAVSALVTAASFAVFIHILVRGTIVRAETLQLAEAATARRLASELAESARLQAQLVHAQRMEAVGTLAAGVAHDMNNVLASISSLAELLRDSASTEQADDVAQILTQSRRGAELTRGLLAFSRRGRYRKEVIRIAPTLRDLLPLLRRTLPKTIEIADDLDVGDLCVDADPVHLGQVVINLALNATDAMNGTGVLGISARSVEHAGKRAIQIAVSDTGHGMDAATRARVFEPFFTTKPIGKGSGLGLSIAWGIVQAHDGSIDVASDPGRGTTFTVTLAAAEAVPVPAPRRRATLPPLVRNTVLVADDESAVREATKRLLMRMGLDVVTAKDGEEALAVFDQHRDAIRLVVLDMGMPVMGGAECFKRLCTLSDVPVVIATGYALEEQVRELVAAGARVLEKPYAASELRREATRLLAS
jgi:signal transduction histidine kinase/CheY-like chemotaxis protein